MPRPRPLAAVALALLATPAVAAAAPAPALPDELSRDRLDRAALVAIPAVYRLEVETRVEGLVTEGGRRVPVPERARSVGRVGTAFAVSPQGYLVSAAHVVSPSAEELAASVYLQKLAIEGRPHSERGARAWVERTGARPTGVRLMLRTVRQADVSGDARRSRMLVPRVVAVDWGRDLVLLRVGLRDAPALALGAGRREGTRVATIGFGSDDPFSAPQRGELVPAVRKGALGSTGPVRGEPDRLLTRVSADVKRGDSGGPAVDQDGRVRGVVLVRLRAGGGAIAPSADITRLLARAGVQAWEGRTTTLFRSALSRMERFDLPGARADLRATIRSYPAHSVARREISRVGALQAAELRIAGTPRLRGGLLAAGAMAALASLICAVALWRMVTAAPGGNGAGRRPG